jgi:glycosyltransferase involved in cell wall biosynthesis
MRVLHIDTEKGFRGGERQVLLLMEGLRARGVEQALLARRGEELGRLARDAGHEVHPFAMASVQGLRARHFVGRLIDTHGYTLLHAHTGNAHTLAWAAGRGRVPVVVTRRVDFAVKSNPLSRRKYLSPAVHFIAISTGVADVLRAGGVAPERIAIVPSGVDAKRWRGATGRARVRQEWGVTGTGPVIGMVGSYVDHKDPLNLVEAAALLLRESDMGEARVVLVGEGELRRDLERAIAGHGLGGRVLLTGWREDVGDCLAGFDLFVMPSKLEGLCTSLLDALAVGLPCVGTRTGGIPDVLVDGVTGVLVPPQDPEALAGALGRVWRDGELRGRLAAAGPGWVEERFSVEAMVEGTLGVYRRVASGGAGG